MLILALLGTTVALGALIALIARMATIALPLFVAITIGTLLFKQGYDLGTAPVIAFMAGVLTLIGGQIAFAATRSTVIRITVALLFVVPAGLAGYSVAHGVMGLGTTSETVRTVAGIVGSIGTGWTAFVRLMARVPTATPDNQPPVSRP